MIINYAHRGASEYYPENTLSAFYAGVDMGANGIETDVHMTSDGVLVLFHDDTLERVTNGKGNVSDHTYNELLDMTVFNTEYGRRDKIATLEELLKYFGWRDLTFAVELKQSHIEKQVIDMIDKWKARSKVILTSFDFENLVRAREYAPEISLGYLYGPAETAEVEKMRSISGGQLCPKADMLTPEKVRQYHEMGFNVRAWGVRDDETMAHAVYCGVDGMTVNFPDRLFRLLKDIE